MGNRGPLPSFPHIYVVNENCHTLSLFTCCLENTGDIKADSIDSPQLLTDHQSNSNLVKRKQ